MTAEIFSTGSDPVKCTLTAAGTNSESMLPCLDKVAQMSGQAEKASCRRCPIFLRVDTLEGFRGEGGKYRKTPAVVREARKKHSSHNQK